MSNKIIRIRDVAKKVGLCRSTIYDAVKKGTFPEPSRLTTGRAIGWLESEIDEWVVKQIRYNRNRRGISAE